MTAPSSSTPSLTQLCTPCQLAIRSGHIARLPGTNHNLNTKPTKESCALCTTIWDSRVNRKQDRVQSTLDWLERQLKRTVLKKNPKFERRSVWEGEAEEKKRQDEREKKMGLERGKARVDEDEGGLQVGDLEDLIVLDANTEHSNAVSEVNEEIKPVLRVVPLRKIDAGLVKRWIGLCEKEHTVCNDTTKPRRHETDVNLVLIDVQHRCLVRSTSSARYLALSYVWGGVEQLQLSMSRAEDLEKHNELDAYWSQLSPVLKDAIEFTRAIGERYLWTDTLCITHDSPQRYEDIAHMNTIYAHALSTLVAVDGVSANSRLHGVEAGSRSIKTIGTNGVLRIGKRRSELASIFAHSVYEQRAWTFQERLLSRRCLYFTNEQVYFHCQASLFSEDRYEFFAQHADPHAMYPSLSWTSSSTRLDTSVEGNLAVYVKLVQQYTRRALTFPSDRLNAFEGISSALGEEWGWDMVCGLPAPCLDRALLWVSNRQFPKRVQEGNRGEVGGTAAATYLPTWSWAGWTDRVHFRMVSKRRHTSCLTHFAMTTVEGVKTFEVLGGDRAAVRALGEEEGAKEWTGKKPNLLLFSTESLPAHQFTLFSTRLAITTQYANEDTPDDKIRRVLDPDGKACGVLAYSGVLPSDLQSASSPSQYRYILISKSDDGPFLEGLDDEVTGEEHAGNSEVYDRKYGRGRTTCNVMLIQGVDEGYAERIAVGQIHEDAWDKSWPVVRRIVLG